VGGWTNTWVECVNAQQTDGPAVTNTTPLSLLGVAAGNLKPVIPAGALDKIGKVLRVRAYGRVGTVVTTPGTLTLDLRLGSVVVANGGAMALNVVAKTNVPWALEWMLTLRAVGGGTTANFMHQGTWTSEAVIGSPAPAAGGAGTHLLPNATPAVGTGFDSTAAQTFDMFATWSVNNAANTLTLHQLILEVLN
jgi:hypothetical protein